MQLSHRKRKEQGIRQPKSFPASGTPRRKNAAAIAVIPPNASCIYVFKRKD